MIVIEQHVQGKTSKPEECEDGIFVGEHYIVVVDGATTTTKKMWNGKKSGRMAMEIIIEACAHLPPGLSAKECMSALNEAIAFWYMKEIMYLHMQDNLIERCTASLVVYSRESREIWFLGDCHALLDVRNYISNEKFVDIVTGNARALFIEGMFRKGMSMEDIIEHDVGRGFILPLIQAQYMFQNTKTGSPFDYAVLDGFFTDSDKIRIVPVPDDTHDVVLASDGYPRLAPTLAECERMLQELLEKDPLLFREHRSTKGVQPGNVSFDDRAFVRFTVD